MGENRATVTVDFESDEEDRRATVEVGDGEDFARVTVWQATGKEPFVRWRACDWAGPQRTANFAAALTRAAEIAEAWAKGEKAEGEGQP